MEIRKTFRLGEDDLRQLMELARAHNYDVSKMLRRLIRDEYKRLAAAAAWRGGTNA